MLSWSSPKNVRIFYTVYFMWREFFKICFISIYIECTFRIYKYICCMFLKSSKTSSLRSILLTLFCLAEVSVLSTFCIFLSLFLWPLLYNKDTIVKFSRYLFFSIWVFFHKQPRFKVQIGKGGGGGGSYLFNSSLPPSPISQTLTLAWQLLQRAHLRT